MNRTLKLLNGDNISNSSLEQSHSLVEKIKLLDGHIRNQKVDDAAFRHSDYDFAKNQKSMEKLTPAVSRNRVHDYSLNPSKPQKELYSNSANVSKCSRNELSTAPLRKTKLFRNTYYDNSRLPYSGYY